MVNCIRLLLQVYFRKLLTGTSKVKVTTTIFFHKVTFRKATSKVIYEEMIFKTHTIHHSEEDWEDKFAE